MKEELKTLKKWIVENYGERCEDFDIGCYDCRVWMAYDILEDASKNPGKGWVVKLAVEYFCP